jgi:hypothetical protein
MSAASVKRLSSATAMAINDTVDVARTAAELDTLTKLVWRGYADGEIEEDDAGRAHPSPPPHTSHRTTSGGTRPAAART